MVLIQGRIRAILIGVAHERRQGLKYLNIIDI